MVRYWVPPGSEIATDAEIATSSGDAALDEAAIDHGAQRQVHARMRLRTVSTIRIAFKLQN